MSDKVALVRLRAKNDQYDESMRKSRKATEDLAGSGDKVAKSSQQLTAVWKGLAVAGAGLFAKQAVDAASNLAEAQSKVNVVFGESSDVITSFAENSATAFGQSKAQALEATGTFGNLFRAIGLTEEQSAKFSTSLTGLASDLASFNNTSVDDALTALRSGLVGETEPLKRFGVNLNEATLKAKALEMGLSDGIGTLDANAKAQAAYALIMEQTTLAQGDFARTSDGLANKQRIAKAEFENTKAELGQNLLPIMQQVTGAATDLLGAFNSLPSSLQTVAVAGAALAVVGPRIGDAWSAVASSFGKVQGALTSTVSSVGYLKSAGVALAAGVTAYHATYAALEGLVSFEGDISALGDALDHLGSSGAGLGDVFNQLDGGDAEQVAGGVQNLIDTLAASNTDRARDALVGLATDWGRFADAAFESDAKQTKEDFKALDEQLESLARKDPSKAKAAYQQLTLALVDQGIAVEDIAARFPRYLDFVGSSAGKERTAADATDDHTAALQRNIDANEERLNLRLRSADADQAVNDAVIAVADAEQGVTEALEAEKEAADGITQANRDLADARRGVAEAHEAVAEAQRGVTDAMRGEQEAAKAVTDAIADQHQAEQDLADARRAATGDSDEMRDAIEGVADAEEALKKSQEESLDAQTALDDARKNYGQTLQNLKDDAEGAADDVLQAEIALRKAKQALADLGKPDKDGKVQPVTADERLAAQIAVREAERRLRELEQRAAEARGDYERNAADVEQSDAVVEATNNVAAAKENEQTARENLAAAQDNVANVQQAAADRVAKAEQTLAEKVEAVQKAQQNRIDAHQKVVDAQDAVRKAADGVWAAEQQVAEKTDAVNAAQQRLNDAKDATVKARDEVKTAEDKVTTALINKANAHRDEETKTRGAERANRDYATSLAGILSLMDPNDPRYKAYMLYLAQLERLNAQGAAQQTVPPTRNPDRYSGQPQDSPLEDRSSSGLRRRAGSGGRAESNLAGPTANTDWTTTPTGGVLTPEIGLTPTQMPHPIITPPPRRGFRQPIGGLIDGTNWHFGPGNTKLTPGNRPVALSPDTVRAITNAAGRSVTIAPRVDASDLNVAQATTLVTAITDDALFAAGVR